MKKLQKKQIEVKDSRKSATSLPMYCDLREDGKAKIAAYHPSELRLLNFLLLHLCYTDFVCLLFRANEVNRCIVSEKQVKFTSWILLIKINGYNEPKRKKRFFNQIVVW